MVIYQNFVSLESKWAFKMFADIFAEMSKKGLIFFLFQLPKAEVFYYVNYSVKNSTVDCKYLLDFYGFFKQSARFAFFVLIWF